MRTTLDIADDVLLAVEDRARRQKRSAGELLSDLAREALIRRNQGFEVREPQSPYGIEAREPESFYGFEPFPYRGGVVSNELINRLRDEDIE
ncbi:MAG TPA: antitoxin [Thermoanaerobaculia bacterium]|jgi:hypothetical protein|nr:antitoxin [Thermoanaerobaculia bacterium]